jgi:hypothetical protein
LEYCSHYSLPNAHFPRARWVILRLDHFCAAQDTTTREKSTHGLQENNTSYKRRSIGKFRQGQSRPSVRDLVGRRHVRHFLSKEVLFRCNNVATATGTRGVHTGASKPRRPGGRRRGQGWAHASYLVPSSSQLPSAARGVDQPIRPRDPPRAPRPLPRRGPGPRCGAAGPWMGFINCY